MEKYVWTAKQTAWQDPLSPMLLYSCSMSVSLLVVLAVCRSSWDFRFVLSHFCQLTHSNFLVISSQTLSFLRSNFMRDKITNMLLRELQLVFLVLNPLCSLLLFYDTLEIILSHGLFRFLSSIICLCVCSQGETHEYKGRLPFGGGQLIPMWPLLE